MIQHSNQAIQTLIANPEALFLPQLAESALPAMIVQPAVSVLPPSPVLLHLLRQFHSRRLASYGAFLGGGSLIALDYGGERLSSSIVFLCANAKGYKRLRTAIAQEGYGSVFAEQQGLRLPQPIETHRLGARFKVVVEGEWEQSNSQMGPIITVEFLFEFRLAFERPRKPAWSPVLCLNEIDCIAEKLLANSDRWQDPAVGFKDLIDLAVLRLRGPLNPAAIAKAESVYPVLEPLRSSILQFQRQSEYRSYYYQQWGIKSPGRVLDGVDLLAKDLELRKTERLALEV